MSEHQTAGESSVRVLGLVAAWITSVSLADVQLWVAILSGLLICFYTSLKIYILWRERLHNPKLFGKQLPLPDTE